MDIKRQSLFTGTVLLLFSNIIVKGLGFFYRIFLVRRLGTEAMGLIEMISPVYSVFLVIAGWGISLGLSTRIAEKSSKDDFESCRSYIAAGKKLLLLFGLTATVISFLLLPLLIHFVADSRSISALIPLLPAILIVTAASAYRGIFQGIRRVSELGNAQIIEQAARVMTGMLVCNILAEHVLEIQIAGISFATLIGEIAGMIFIRSRYRKISNIFNDTKLSSMQPSKEYFTELMRFGTPVTVSRLAISIMAMAEALIIPSALIKSGMSTSEATAAYGALMSVAVTLLHLPGIFTSALSVSVVPAIAESGNINDLLQSRINKSLNATVIFTLPGMICLFFFAEQLCTLLFHSPEAASELKILACGGIFLYIQITLGGILQGMGKVWELLKNNLISGIVLLFNLYFFTSIPYLNTTGTAWAFNFDFIFTMLLNFISIKKHMRFKPDIKNMLIKPLTAGGVTIMALLLQNKKLALYGEHGLMLIAALAITMLIYFLALWAAYGFRLQIRMRH